MNEIWKTIDGYENYEVSNLGNVRNLNYLRTGMTRVLKPGQNGCDYLYVILCKNGKTKKYYIHRLVATAFLPNPSNLPQVNHKDENPKNNVIENLEWCTNEYNCNYGTHNQRVAEAKRGKLFSEEHKRKLSEAAKRYWKNKKQL